jgi:hypothetical protein
VPDNAAIERFSTPCRGLGHEAKLTLRESEGCIHSFLTDTTRVRIEAVLVIFLCAPFLNIEMLVIDM